MDFAFFYLLHFDFEAQTTHEPSDIGGNLCLFPTVTGDVNQVSRKVDNPFWFHGFPQSSYQGFV